ncbi:MAG: glucose-6-phosphate isomerase [Clostridia bacterium]|nr:glucose-6-phosphate isomerase [Clostridia bacterium]
MLKFDYSQALPFIRESEIARLEPQVLLSERMLEDRTGPGSEYLGWMDPSAVCSRSELERIQHAARRIHEGSDVLVVIGIGGSYLGARAAIEMLSSAFPSGKDRNGRIETIFCGHNLSATYMADLMRWLDGHEVSVNVISKSGTTTETAVAFRVLRAFMEARYGKEGARSRIYATTDRTRGALRELAEKEGYETFSVPNDIGGRYSVLTAVGLLPIAAAGIDVHRILAGASAMAEACARPGLSASPAARYAAVRTALYRRGYRVEILAGYEPYLHTIGEWWKQLFGESEGKDGKGIFPAAVDNTTDLHSMGQYIQDGARFLFETVLDVLQPRVDFEVPETADSGDGIGYLAGRGLHSVNRTAMQGTVLAHVDGGVPNLRVQLPGLTPHAFGQLVYFFEKSCALSGYMLAVNPFDQPGVEDYKQNMFALLGKPGHEARRDMLEKRLRG